MLFGCAFLVLFAACLSYVCHKLVEKPPPIVEGSSTTADPMHPKTLDELLALSPDQLEKVDLALINLLCAVGLRGSENLDVEECLRTLDAWTLNIHPSEDTWLGLMQGRYGQKAGLAEDLLKAGSEMRGKRVNAIKSESLGLKNSTAVQNNPVIEQGVKELR